MRCLLLISLLLALHSPAFATYKCASDGKITYSDHPCQNGKSSELDDTENKPSETDIAKARQQNVEEKNKLKQLETARHKREAQQEKREQQIQKAVDARNKKCDSLVQKKEWAEEDVRRATGANLERAKLKARRATEKYKLACKR